MLYATQENARKWLTIQIISQWAKPSQAKGREKYKSSGQKVRNNVLYHTDIVTATST